MDVLILLALLLGAPADRRLPNLYLTPGVVRPLTPQQVCHPPVPWGRDRRYVTLKMKKQVAVWYRVAWADHVQYEFDHLIPRELGGADDIHNLWMQRWPDARVKDRLENTLHRLVCSNQMSLEMAQESIRTNWIQASKQIGRQ